MARTRVLVVEDSATVREVLCATLEADSDLDVVGTAADGQQAIELCRTLRPDVITMDMVMPGMDGLAATEHIMAYFPTPILVVSSSVNRGEMFKTYDALAAGAIDVLEKPSGREAPGVWERQLISAVKMVARIKVITHLRARTRKTVRPQVAAPAAGRVELIAIGASTGGPAATVEVLRGLPPGLDIPVLFVLHINPMFSYAFAEWLRTQTNLPTQFTIDGQPLAELGGKVVMAPPGRHMIVRGGCTWLDDGPERHSCKPSIDVLFESLARECRDRVAAALLTGMGRDGAAGLLAIRAAGGTTIAQDEATSVVYGMPREAKLLNAAQHILPVGAIGAALGAATHLEKERP